MSNYIWHSKPVMVKIDASICGPLAVHGRTNDLDRYTITHVSTGLAMYGLLSAVGVDTTSIKAVTSAAEKLMAKHPDLNGMLQRIHDAVDPSMADNIRKELIETFLSDSKTK